VTGVLEHYREKEINYWFSTFRGVDLILKAKKDVNVHFIKFTVAIPVNSNSEFQERF
jgi:hypothetical protein